MTENKTAISNFHSSFAASEMPAMAMRLFVAPLFVANVALSMTVDTSCLGTDASINDEAFLSERVGNETLHAINDGERAFGYVAVLA